VGDEHEHGGDCAVRGTIDLGTADYPGGLSHASLAAARGLEDLHRKPDEERQPANHRQRNRESSSKCGAWRWVLKSEQSRQAEYDRLTASLVWARTLGEIVR